MDEQNYSPTYQFKVLNLKLVTVRPTSGEVYGDLIEKVFKKGSLVSMGKNVGFLNEFNIGKLTDGKYYYGMVTKAKKADPNYELNDDKELVPIEHEGQYFTDPHSAFFVFAPEAHRFAFIETEKVKMQWFKSFINKSFKKVLDEKEKIDLIIKTTDTFIEEYLKSGDIRKIKIKLSYSNADSFNNAAMKAMEKNWKETHLREVTLTGVSDKQGNIDLMNNDLLNPMAGLAINNGEISAWDEENTSSEPTYTTRTVNEVYDVQSSEKSWMLDIFKKLMNTFRPEND
ncbi:MAG: DUF4747 family protein [Carboxylicivirga sp.]|jgi:hypothetical protein|nr:DUF4747 family protein [Carboxylicivirga sp.]